MQTKINKEIKEEIEDMNTHVNNLDKEIERLNGENSYLLKRLKELRHKTWFPVYKENLELQEANKNLDATCKEVIEEYSKLEKEVEELKAVIQSVETFIGRFTNEKR